ncbi:hypothetical protein CDD81_7481 [Ophiocordyceps australis]|uniref:Uncharacterized protein n=1 Tax=Ophiocordyceps australis TaxID=1399860 RepID=A0A2C5YFD9_9HYPO|nr:hypothetical protein CDD81_7481 [Ophiocordyceps australis]
MVIPALSLEYQSSLSPAWAFVFAITHGRVLGLCSLNLPKTFLLSPRASIHAAMNPQAVDFAPSAGSRMPLSKFLPLADNGPAIDYPADSAPVHSFDQYHPNVTLPHREFSYEQRTATHFADCEYPPAHAWVYGPSLTPWQPQPIPGHHGNLTGVDVVQSASFDLGLDRLFNPLVTKTSQEDEIPYSQPAAFELDTQMATKSDGMQIIQSQDPLSSHQLVRRKTRSASNKKKWTLLPFNRYASRSSPTAKSPRLLGQPLSPKRAPWAKSEGSRREAARQILQLGRARKSRAHAFSSIDAYSSGLADISENHGVGHDFGHPLAYSLPHAQPEELSGLDFLAPSFQNSAPKPSIAPTSIAPDVYHLQNLPAVQDAKLHSSQAANDYMLPDLNGASFEPCQASVENTPHIEWDPVAQTSFGSLHIGNESPRIKAEDQRDKIIAHVAPTNFSAASSHPSGAEGNRKHANARNKRFEKGSLKGKGLQKSCRDSPPRQGDCAAASEKSSHLSNQAARGTWSNSVRWMSDGAKDRMALAKMMNNLHHIGADKSPFIPQTLVELAALRADMAEENKQRLSCLVGQRMAEMERKKSCAQSLSTQHEALKVEKLFLGKQMHDELSPVFASCNCFNEQLPNSKALFASWPSLAELKDAGDNRGSQAVRSLPPPRIDVLDPGKSTVHHDAVHHSNGTIRRQAKMVNFHPAYIMPVSPPEEQQEWCSMPAQQTRLCNSEREYES